MHVFSVLFREQKCACYGYIGILHSQSCENSERIKAWLLNLCMGIATYTLFHTLGEIKTVVDTVSETNENCLNNIDPSIARKEL